MFLNQQLFVANQNKPADIVGILVTNRSKLLRLFADFKTDKGTTTTQSLHHWFLALFVLVFFNSTLLLSQRMDSLRLTKLMLLEKLLPLNPKVLEKQTKRGEGDSYMNVLYFSFCFVLFSIQFGYQLYSMISSEIDDTFITCFTTLIMGFIYIFAFSMYSNGLHNMYVY